MSTRALTTAAPPVSELDRLGRGDSLSRRQARGLAGDRATRRPRARAQPRCRTACSPPSCDAETRMRTAATSCTPSRRILLDRGARLATGTGDADPRPRDVVRLHRRPGRRVRGVVHARRRDRDTRRGRLEHERDGLRERLRAAGRHPPRPQRRARDGDLDPRLRNRRRPHRVERAAVLRPAGGLYTSSACPPSPRRRRRRRRGG